MSSKNPPKCLYPDECDLWKGVQNPYIRVSGSKKPDIMFVGEAPGFTEDTMDANFVGKTGQFLREVLKEAGYNMKKVAISNTVKCRPVDRHGSNRTPRDSEVNKCKHHVMAEIEVLKPKLVVLLGAVPLKGLLKKTGITELRGRLFEVDGVQYLPTFHPSKVYREPNSLEDFVKDIEKAKAVVYGEEAKPAPVKYHFLDTIERLGLLIKHAEEANELAFDCETNMLSPFSKGSKIVCVSIAFKEREAFVIPYYHSQQIFRLKDLRFAKGIVKEILECRAIRKCAQNAKFDMEWLEITEGVVVAGLDFDTQHAQYLLSEVRSTTKLSYMAWKYTDMGGYDEPLDKYKAKHKEADPQRGGSYANIPWEVLYPYSAGDADCTLRCRHRLEELLK